MASSNPLIHKHWTYFAQFIDIVHQARGPGAAQWTTATANRAWGWAHAVEKLAVHYTMNPNHHIQTQLEHVSSLCPDIQFKLSLQVLQTARELLLDSVSGSYFITKALGKWCDDRYAELVTTSSQQSCHPSLRTENPKSLQHRQADREVTLNTASEELSGLREMLSNTQQQSSAHSLQSIQHVEALVASHILFHQLVQERLAHQQLPATSDQSACILEQLALHTKWELYVRQSDEALEVVVLLLCISKFRKDFGWHKANLTTIGTLPKFLKKQQLCADVDPTLASAVEQWALDTVLGVHRVWEVSSHILGMAAQCNDHFGVAYYKCLQQK